MIYFDNAATTSINEEVLTSYNFVIKSFIGNSSSLHKEGLKSAELEKKARIQIANFFRVKEDEVIFTSGATESNNLALIGTALKYKNRGKHIISSKIEHPSVLNTLSYLKDEHGFDITLLDVDEDGLISVEDLKNNIRDDTILVSIMSVNNEVGVIQPIQEIANLIKGYKKIFFHVDATQSIGKININFDNVDLISMSAHKIHGLKGTGLLIKKSHCDLLPLIHGGGHQNNYRSGTTNIAGEVALAKTIRIAFENQNNNFNYVEKLNKYFRKRLTEIDGVKINSSDKCSPYIVSFITNKKGSVVAEALSNEEIYVSTKSACSSKKTTYSSVLKAMGKDEWTCQNSIRVSFSELNTYEEIDVFVNTLKRILQMIK